MQPAEFTAIKIKCGLSQSKLVKPLGKTIRTISRYETGVSKIPQSIARYMRELERNGETL